MATGDPDQDPELDGHLFTKWATSSTSRTQWTQHSSSSSKTCTTNVVLPQAIDVIFWPTMHCGKMLEITSHCHWVMLDAVQPEARGSDLSQTETVTSGADNVHYSTSCKIITQMMLCCVVILAVCISFNVLSGVFFSELSHCTDH